MLKPPSPAGAQSAAKRFRFLAEAAAWRYRAQGRAVRWAVLGKLLYDPFYQELLAANRLPEEGLLIDVGCGRGTCLALWGCAQALGMVGGGRRGGPTLRLMGIEPRADLAESARLALAGKAEIITSDLHGVALPCCQAAILRDVLLRLAPDEQDRLLERLVAALAEGGLLILREPDAGAFGHRAGIRFAGNTLGLLRGGQAKRLHPRSGEEWRQRLESLGLKVENQPMDSGMGFAQVLLLAQKAGGAPAENG